MSKFVILRLAGFTNPRKVAVRASKVTVVVEGHNRVTEVDVGGDAYGVEESFVDVVNLLEGAEEVRA